LVVTDVLDPEDGGSSKLLDFSYPEDGDSNSLLLNVINYHLT